MIKIKYHYTDDFRRKGFTIKGHADFAPIGQDIVCSAVTSNSIGVVIFITISPTIYRTSIY